MGLFKRRGLSKAGRVAKNVAKRVVLPEEAGKDAKAREAKAQTAADAPAPEHSDAEYDELKAKYDALMVEKWKAYYKESCEGECETCEYYDWCPDDFDGVFDDEAADAFDGDAPDGDQAADAEAGGEGDEGDEGDGEEGSDEEGAADEQEPELTEEQLAAKEAAEAYYEDGCDGECDGCEHYEWCPAEEEADEDDKVIFKDVTQGDVKRVAKEGVGLARETALAARDLKAAIDDITGGLNMKDLLK